MECQPSDLQDSTGDGEGAAVQWMTAGRGLLHEEMWRTGDASMISGNGFC